MRQLMVGFAILLLAATAHGQTRVVAWAEDATTNIQAALDKGGTVVIPYVGKDWVVSRPLTFASDTTLILRPYVQLVAKRGCFTGLGDAMFVIRQVSNVTILGYHATLLGRGRELTDTCRHPHSQWRHGISTKSSTRVTIEGLTIKGMGGDGIYIGTITDQLLPSRIVRICDVVCDGNYRNGLSVISVVGLYVHRCEFVRSSGHNPYAGIDIEPNSAQDPITGVYIGHCLAEYNDGAGYVVWLHELDKTSPATSILFVNCAARRNGRPATIVSAPNGLGRGSWISFRDCVFLDSRKPDSGPATFADCVWGETVEQVTR